MGQAVLPMFNYDYMVMPAMVITAVVNHHYGLIRHQRL
jgi:hypothetical protein